MMSLAELFVASICTPVPRSHTRRSVVSSVIVVDVDMVANSAVNPASRVMLSTNPVDPGTVMSKSLYVIPLSTDTRMYLFSESTFLIELANWIHFTAYPVILHTVFVSRKLASFVPADDGSRSLESI